MPSRKSRNRKRQNKASVLPVLIVLTLIVIGIIVLMIYRSGILSGNAPETTPMPVAIDPDNYVDQSNVTPAPLVVDGSSVSIVVTPEPEVTYTPTPEPAVTPVPQDQVTDTAVTDGDVEPTAEPAYLRLSPTAQPGDYFLPIYDRALRTQDDELEIALTIDVCGNSEVMAEYVATAQYYGAKLTLFPTGEALAREKMKAAFVTCATKLGYEIENFVYNKKYEFNLTGSELALQLWKQNITLSYIIGKDYEQHFYRPISIASVGDQRTHYLLGQMGLYGMASYTYNYDGYTDESLIATLANGNIYRFDMSQKSLQRFKALVAAATSKGYKCVTMNRLFGLNENVISDTLTLDRQELPLMDGYKPTYYELKVNTHSYATMALQTRLAALGYLKPEEGKDRYYADGMYGATTSIAVSAFQAKVGLPATGNADAATQEALFSSDAPVAGA